MNNNKTGATDVHTEFRDRIVEIARRPIGDVRPNPRNPRKHGAGQRSRLSAVLDAFGKVGVLLSFIDDDGVETLFDGHARQGIDPAEVWHVARTDLTRREVDELVIMYDPLAAEAETDTAILSALVADYDRADPVLAEMVAGLAADAGIAFAGEPEADAEPQHDRAEELRAAWGVETGQLWRLPSRTPGQEHRLICGDCADTAVVERVMAGERADMIFTDPPYNHASENTGFAAAVSPSHRSLMEAEWDKGFLFAAIIPSLELVMGDNCSVYICTSWHLAGDIWKWMSIRSSCNGYCVWSKINPMPSLAKRHWTWASELICYATYGKHVFNFPSEGHASNVWRFAKHKETGHPTEKPVEVPQHAIQHSSAEGNVVVDLFSGSGTTIIAAENLARQCRAVEISPAYVAVALQRYRDAFGIEPELIA